MITRSGYELMPLGGQSQKASQGTPQRVLRLVEAQSAGSGAEIKVLKQFEFDHTMMTQSVVIERPAIMRARSSDAKATFLSSELFGSRERMPIYDKAPSQGDMHGARVGDGFPNERKQNMLRSDLFGNSSPPAAPGASRTDIFPGQGNNSGSIKQGDVGNVNQRKQDHLSSDVFGTGHVPVGSASKSRSDIASGTFGRKEAHNNFGVEDTGSRKQEFLTSDVFDTGHPSEYQPNGRAATGPPDTTVCKSGNVARGEGAFAAVGGKQASSGRKKDHLKSDLFGRETHNSRTSTAPAQPPAKPAYDGRVDSKDRTHQMLQSDLFGNVTPNPNTGSQKRRTDIFPEPREAGLLDLSDNYQQRKAAVLTSDNLICGSGVVKAPSSGDPTGSFTGGKGTGFKDVEDVQARSSFKNAGDKDRHTAMLGSNLFGRATPAAVANKARTDIGGTTFGRKEQFNNFETDYTGERKQQFLTSDIFDNGHSKDFQTGGRPASSPNGTGLVKNGPVGRGDSPMGHVGGRAASGARKNDQLKSDLFERSAVASPQQAVPNQVINKSGAVADAAAGGRQGSVGRKKNDLSSDLFGRAAHDNPNVPPAQNIDRQSGQVKGGDGLGSTSIHKTGLQGRACGKNDPFAHVGGREQSDARKKNDLSSDLFGVAAHTHNKAGSTRIDRQSGFVLGQANTNLNKRGPMERDCSRAASAGRKSVHLASDLFGRETPDKPSGKAAHIEAEVDHVFIKGLSLDTTESDIKKIASKYGTVASCRAVMDPLTQSCKGYGFVSYTKFGNAEDLASCLKGLSLRTGQEALFVTEETMLKFQAE